MNTELSLYLTYLLIQILNAIAEHGHSREVYLAIMESLGAYRSEVARIQLIRMLSKGTRFKPVLASNCVFSLLPFLF